MNTTTTFSPYNDKSSAKRGFARKFKDMDPGAAESYLDKVDGKWGFSFDDKGPVLTNVPPAALKQPLGDAAVFAAGNARADGELAAAIEAGADLRDAADEGDKVGSAFGSFALNQLTAQPTAALPVVTPRAPVITKIEKNRPESNGVKRPSAGTLCAQVWDMASSMSNIAEGMDGVKNSMQDHNQVPTLSAVVKACEAVGINKFTARTQYARWRVFHGITGRIVA